MASLFCTVSKGDFPIAIVWTLSNRSIESFQGISVMRTNKRISQLSIDSVQAEHAGEYTCSAKNSAGTAHHSAILHVNGIFNSLSLFLLVLPHITPFDFDGEANRGDSVQVSCYVSKGDLPLSFSWILNGKPIQDILGIGVSSFGKKTSVLSIDSVNELYAGNYTCLASNRAGISTYTANLIVKGTVAFSCFLS
jgi:hypothetical protein